MGTVEVVRGDITKLAVDVIVNAANERLLGGGGVDGAIHRAAGPHLLAACRSLGEVRPNVRCPTGEARITPGFALPARWVIHTVGPVWQGGSQGEHRLLAACYRNSLALAASAEARSVAFPAISTGVYGYPKMYASRVAAFTCAEFLRQPSSIERVVLIAFGDLDLEYLRLAIADAQRPSAKRSDWKALPLPETCKALELELTLSPTEFTRLCRGTVPREMEDKWFIFYEAPWLYMHRSWTGFCIFRVRFEPVGGGMRVAETWVNRDQEQYPQDDDAFDVKYVRDMVTSHSRGFD